MKKNYDVDINKTVVSTKRFLNFHDVPHLMNRWVRGKTVAADTEFDAEKRFPQLVEQAGGRGVAPLRHKTFPVAHKMVAT